MSIILGVFLLAAHAPAGEPAGAAATGQYRNLFREYLGKTDAEISAPIGGAWHQIVAGDPDSQRLLYPVAGDMAYVPDVANNDVRTEGMSDLMMIAVQLDRQREIPNLWSTRFVVNHEGLRGGSRL